MTDFFKDVFEAAQQRIRSPFIGSVIFAFIAVNWQALFYLFFAEASVLARIDCFNDMTSHMSLYWLPLGIGTAMALILPFVRVGFVWVVRFANRRVHHLQDEEASRRRVAGLLLKAKEDEALDKANEARERRKIHDEKRLKDANEAGGEALVAEIKKDREDGEEADRSVSPDVWRETQFVKNLDTLSKLIIFAIGLTREGNVNIDTLYEVDEFLEILRQNGYQYTDVRLEQEYVHAVKELTHQGVLEVSDLRQFHRPENYTAATLSVFGYKIFDRISPALTPPASFEASSLSS